MLVINSKNAIARERNISMKHPGLTVVAMQAWVFHGSDKRALEDKPKPTVKEPTGDWLFWTFYNE
jgi:hypothetical protein